MKAKKKAPEQPNVFVVIRDGIVFDGSFDDAETAQNKCDYYNHNYRGHWKAYEMTDKQFQKFMHGGHFKPLRDITLARAVRSLLQGQIFRNNI